MLAGALGAMTVALLKAYPIMPPLGGLYGGFTVGNACLYVAEQAVMNHFLSYISSAWFCELNYDDLSRENLLRHITAMRIRVNFGITIINPLIEQIKRHYPLIYEMTLAAFSELDLWFSGPISDDEIGYLVMHIGAILEETQSRDAVEGRAAPGHRAAGQRSGRRRHPAGVPEDYPYVPEHSD